MQNLYILQIYFHLFLIEFYFFSIVAAILLITVNRKDLSSKAIKPATVVSPGEYIQAINIQGFSLLSRMIYVIPRTVCATN